MAKSLHNHQPSRSCVQNIFFLLLLFNESFCFLKLSVSTRNETTAEGREILVTNLKSLGADLTESVEFNDRQLTETLLTEIKDVWRRLMQQPMNVSFSLEDDITNSNDDLTHYTAKLLFLAKDRRCESPFETFFKDQCLPIRSIEDCPENMELYDGPNNEGFCDCHSDVKGNNSLRLIYWDETGKCYFQNTQGPCDVGQWFVLKDVPKCELIPEGCPADGEHVYGTVRTFKSSEASKCWKIGSPCSKSNSKTSDTTSQFDVKVAQVEQSEDGNLRVFCDVKKYYVKATSESSVGFKPSCNAGTYRSRFDKCARGFWG
ncbi:uncharacterized protein LOC124315478 [Daphnia pulicaria]|uniref:uncharacterized protein LOC124315478 n=1 Tax=Daphnia pulicaria TaxID=35523 RepID=UPI001EEB1E6A|nr:uncharacterized protein LOC124315478 [Daphnia pulicaria]